MPSVISIFCGESGERVFTDETRRHNYFMENGHNGGMDMTSSSLLIQPQQSTHKRGKKKEERKSPGNGHWANCRSFQFQKRGRSRTFLSPLWQWLVDATDSR
ncbi:hypothetical protein CDAR_273981 [Caerostris darwini]|uniref:Uncharacterized protein n=1 Tax=Caerostris darwini TaxID=1538125 RepID=A0AAV4RB98_9ARAC|nr:hypothetical protein CDAR_273981 [Caerostris darwini]